MGLGEDLRLLSEQVRKRQAFIKGEEATKQALILPFIQALGYDIYDPTETQPEYVADFAKKRGGVMEKVDYALHLKGQPAQFIECKATDAAPEDHDGQLARYFNATPSVRIGVVTNGIRYRFFTDLQSPNVMDAVPFLEFNVLAFTDRDVELLRPFTKEFFDATSIQGHAEEIIFVGKVTALINELLRNPSESFVRFLLAEVELVSGRVTRSVVERFVPIVKKSIQTTLLDMMTKSIQQEIAQNSPPPPTVTAIPAEALQRAAEASEAPGVAQVETTEVELEIFRIVQRMCSESALRQSISYKDSTTYFGINLGKVTSWFLRAFTNGKKKSLVTRLPLEQAAMLSPGFEVESAPDGIGKSRVYFNAATDIEKLRSLVLVAYEEEARRQSSSPVDGGGSTSESASGA
ncbi:type I restriction enzyme HsdR N-terminal domain-containing protein [Myxococcus sp. CA051A]|uniref:type I restriction endonuclease n=1 Tax=unclassified Myxococcus TaxID=2648731 RepID=UPI00157B1775|nr:MULTISPECIES: type I restriction endonuclease [unclassified Myxococcus]NTX38902.1 type I restriction enzyme HsdR N-terminal domain-containing protein [Myxococcus sp. CA033]NTX67370.1 type I restriction enzyme HsdR N-terminal domain-containing protein [Myxococcus sp. CA051A]